MRWVILALLMVMLLYAPPPVQAANSSPDEPFTGTALCLPDVYLNPPGDCLPLGPSQTLTEMARKGLSYPPRPLPAFSPPAELATNPVFIARLNLADNEPANLYASLDDAIARNNAVRQIPAGAGLRYVSYIQEERIDGKPYLQLKSGEWVRASPAGYSNFQGLVFRKTPTTAFGWVIDNIKARSAPSFTAPEVGEDIYNQTPVQIFSITQAEGMEWYMIGQDLWVPHLKARRARVDTNPPSGVTGNRWISVDLFDQVVTVYENGQLVFATLVSTGGKPFYTRPGLFQIYKKKPLETMSGAFEPSRSDYYYLEDVPWTMYFDEARALHGAYWRPWFGVSGTHGCVNFSIGDAAWLYQWANEGDWVYVYDPSGETPTDPSLYGSGGA